MKQLIDLTNKNEIGYIEWEFIHDMQGVVPLLITPELISLTREFLDKIPSKWDKVKEKLIEHASPDRTVYIGIADIENLGDEFKVKGTFQDKHGVVLPFHRVIIYDKDRFEDDYIGAVITDKDGHFSLAFGKKVFSDFGLETEPYIYFKVYYFEKGRFVELGKIMPEVFEKVETREKKVLLEFGTISL